MPRFSRKVHVGSAPGVLRAPEIRRVESTSVSVIRYGPDHLEEHTAIDVAELASLMSQDSETGSLLTWVDVIGLHDVELLAEIGRLFEIHPLALEDIANVGQRPKLEEYGGSLFIVLRNFHVANATPSPAAPPALEPEQVSLFLRPGLVVSFQEIPGDCFEPVRERIRRANLRIRSRGADYLAYALFDALVDSFYPILESLGETVEELEEELIEEATSRSQDTIHLLRRNLLALRRAVWPMREVSKALLRDDLPLVGDETRLYLRDCYDHANEVLEIVESYREVGTGLQEVYLSTVSQRLNEVMKVLTIIATIFIPLTFIAGIYGMNFEVMPELGWPWAYPATLGLMAVLGLGLVIYFRRRGWM